MPSERCHIRGMADKPKRPRDTNQLAKLIVDVATGEADGAQPAKDERAASLGTRGGRKRAENLSAERRSEIAKKAAATRWAKKAVPSEGG